MCRSLVYENTHHHIKLYTAVVDVPYYPLCFVKTMKNLNREKYVYFSWLLLTMILLVQPSDGSIECSQNENERWTLNNAPSKCTFIILWRCETFEVFSFVAFELIEQKTNIVFPGRKKRRVFIYLVQKKTALANVNCNFAVKNAASKSNQLQ